MSHNSIFRLATIVATSTTYLISGVFYKQRRDPECKNVDVVIRALLFEILASVYTQNFIYRFVIFLMLLTHKEV